MIATSYAVFLHMHASWFHRVLHAGLSLTGSLEGLGIYIYIIIYIIYIYTITVYM